MRAEVGQFVLFPVRPQILDWVQFRGVAGKILQPQTSSLLLYKLPHGAAAMSEHEVKEVARSASRYESGSIENAGFRTAVREWPAPLGPEAFQGLIGDFVRLVGP